MAATETKRLTMMLFYAYVLVLAFFTFQILRPFVSPLIWAGILALCMWPLQRKLMRRHGETRAALMVTLLTLLLVIGPVFWLAYSLVSQASQVVMDLHASLMKVENMEKVRGFWERMSGQLPLPSIEEVRSRIAGAAGTVTSVVAGQAAGILQNVAGLMFKTIITFVAMFFFLRGGERATATIRHFLPFNAEQQNRLIQQTCDLVYSGLTATLVIACAQGLVGGVIFAILGLDAPLFWGVCMVFCAIIPVVGTMLIWGPAVAFLMLSGHLVQGFILLGCGFGVIGMLDNILRPILLQGKVPMNLLLMFLSILGGISLFGFIGLILGPVVIAAAVSLVDILKMDAEVDSGCGKTKIEGVCEPAAEE